MGLHATSLDVILVSNPRRFKKSINVTCGLSDYHNCTAVASRINMAPQKPRFVNYICYRNFVEDDNIKDLETLPLSVCDVFDDFDDKYWCYDMLLSDVIDKHAPVKKRLIKNPG